MPIEQIVHHLIPAAEPIDQPAPPGQRVGTVAAMSDSGQRHRGRRELESAHAGECRLVNAFEERILGGREGGREPHDLVTAPERRGGGENTGGGRPRRWESPREGGVWSKSGWWGRSKPV